MHVCTNNVINQENKVQQVTGYKLFIKKNRTKTCILHTSYWNLHFFGVIKFREIYIRLTSYLSEF